MSVLGIVCEYNPFHNGHKFHIKQAKMESLAESVVCLMSGDFTQRGEVACQDKWTRARWALLNGADLVLELPVIFATSNAGDFAKGGISILEKAGCDFIAFGVEDSQDNLVSLANFIKSNSGAIDDRIKSFIKDGLSYPVSRERAVLELASAKDSSEAETFAQMLHQKPNNVLALEYLLNIKSSKPIIISRQGSGYNDENINGLPSATAIRTLAKEGKKYDDFVPSQVRNLQFIESNKLYQQIVSKVLNMTEEEIDNIYSADEGFGSKLKKQIRTCRTYEDIIELLVSKRHKRTRIQRFLTQLLLNIAREDLIESPIYVRVLGFNQKGSKILKEIRKNEEIPVITNIGKNYKLMYPENIANSLAFDIIASDYYNVLTGQALYSNSDFVKSPEIVKSL